MFTRHVLGVDPRAPGPSAYLVERDWLEAYGATGDLFGATSALFSGLALAGVALTLWLQMNDRRRDARPLLIPSFDGTSDLPDGGGTVEIAYPTVEDAIVVVPINIAMPVHNQSSEAALNVFVRANLFGQDVKFENSVSVPIAGNLSQFVRLSAKLQGSTAKRFQSAICQESGSVSLAIELLYENLDRVKWRTGVRYRLSLDSVTRDRDQKLLTSAVQQPANQNAAPIPPADATVWTATTKISLRAEPESGSWTHGEIATQ